MASSGCSNNGSTNTSSSYYYYSFKSLPDNEDNGNAGLVNPTPTPTAAQQKLSRNADPKSSADNSTNVVTQDLEREDKDNNHGHGHGKLDVDNSGNGDIDDDNVKIHNIHPPHQGLGMIGTVAKNKLRKGVPLKNFHKKKASQSAKKYVHVPRMWNPVTLVEEVPDKAEAGKLTKVLTSF
eukprot:jgi/Psemu1/47488/gm1.47488_g